MTPTPAIWFPTVRTGTGTDVFTERLVAGLQARGLRAEITWLPLRAEYAPWTVPVPPPPTWANVSHVNTWLHPRFIPSRLPALATLHHSIHDPALRPYKGCLRAAYHRSWIAPIERRVLHRADLAVAVSQFVADMAKRTLSKLPMQVIYNGVDTELFRPGDRVPQQGMPFRLLYVGSWIARKGVDLLPPIMRALGEGFQLHYTGGPAAEKDKPSMPSNMHDIGRLNTAQVIVAMQNADAFLFPSRSEGLPLVAVEAMACGLPVIGTRGTSVAEVVADGCTGLLCQAEEPRDFVQGARRLAVDAQVGKGMWIAARRHAASNFSFDAMIDSYVQLYRQLTGQRGRRNEL
ncbi:MAG: glycogen synthase [Thauera sp.]|nr:glycosyltransferase family 4 protein [Thauera sp.]MDI3489249.1 glycogen synthase [Thauera sp.]